MLYYSTVKNERKIKKWKKIKKKRKKESSFLKKYGI